MTFCEICFLLPSPYYPADNRKVMTKLFVKIGLAVSAKEKIMTPIFQLETRLINFLERQLRHRTSTAVAM